jgi:choice-of-anchor C domain-containing protein
MKKSLLRVAVVAASIGPASAFAATNLVTDGNFNSPGCSGGFCTVNSPSTFDNGAWTVTGGSVDLIGSYWQAPPTGGGSVDLDGNSPGGISQSLSLAAGSYTLTFYLSGNPDGGSSTKTVDVTVGNVSELLTFTTGSNSGTSMNYVPESLTFWTSGPTTLYFASADESGPYGPVVGGVSVTAVPEPATWAMMLAGFAGFAFMGFRRRAKDRYAL